MTVTPGTELDAAAPADGKALEQFEQRFRLSDALAERGLELNTLSPDELRELEAEARTRLSPVLDAIADHWQQEHGNLKRAREDRPRATTTNPRRRRRDRLLQRR